MVWPHALARHFQAQVIQARERAQVRAIKDSIGHVEVFQMDGVGTPIIGRPRPLPGHDTPNPAHNTYTLKCEESDYGNASVSLPSLSEQKAIAAVFRKHGQLVEQYERMLEMLDELVKSRFVEMFGDPIDESSPWPKLAIKDFCTLKIGPFGSSLHKQDYITGGHPLVNPSHIADGKIVPANDLTISEEKYQEMEAYHLEPGDVVLGRRGEIGRCAVVYSSGYLCGTGSMIVRPSDKCRPDYLQRVLSFPSFKDALERNAVGQTMKNLNAKIVGQAVVALPSINAQNEFAAFVQQVDKLEFETQQAIDKLQTLYDSLAQEYFGE